MLMKLTTGCTDLLVKLNSDLLSEFNMKQQVGWLFLM